MTAWPLLRTPRRLSPAPPRWPFTINRDSPLSKGLVSLVTRIDGRTIEISRSRPLTIESGTPAQSTYRNRLSDAPSSALYLGRSTPEMASPTTPFSVTAWIAGPNVWTASGIMLINTRSGSNKGWSVARVAVSGNQTLMRFTIHNVADYNSTAYGPQHQAGWQPVSWVWNGNSTTVEFWWNGAQLGSAVATGAMSAGGINTIRYLAGPWDGVAHSMAVYSRALSVAERQLQARNEFELYYELGRRQFYFVSAAAPVAAPSSSFMTIN